MPFKALYNRRQTEATWLPLQWYVDDALNLSWVDDVQIKRTSALPKTHLRGMIIRHNTGNMPHALTFTYSIYIAAGLTPEFERFVIIKELMHLYFGPDAGTYATDNQVALENHMQEMFAASADISSPQVVAEKKALWMAISVLTPETDRQNFRDNGIPIGTVTGTLHVPPHTATALLSMQFDHEISNLLAT